MTFSDIADLAQAIGAVAIVVSLLYLAAQVRQGSQAVRLASTQAYYDRIAQLFAAIATDPELARLWKSASNDSKSLTRDDRNRLALVIMPLLAAHEEYYYRYERGFVDRELFENSLPSVRRLLLSPPFSLFFEWRRGSISERFREFLISDVAVQQGAAAAERPVLPPVPVAEEPRAAVTTRDSGGPDSRS